MGLGISLLGTLTTLGGLVVAGYGTYKTTVDWGSNVAGTKTEDVALLIVGLIVIILGALLLAYQAFKSGIL